MRSIPYSMHTIPYSMHTILHIIPCSMHTILYSMHSILYSMHTIPYSMHSIPYSMHTILYSMHTILYSMHSISHLLRTDNSHRQLSQTTLTNNPHWQFPLHVPDASCPCCSRALPNARFANGAASGSASSGDKTPAREGRSKRFTPHMELEDFCMAHLELE